jgi:drug/metabolite transporter (DMT)-like permease
MESIMPRTWKSSPAIALTALVGVTAVWGGTFLLVQNAVNRMPVVDFLSLRFILASLIMLAVRPGCLRGMTRLGIVRGIALGIVLGLGYITQTIGLLYASAAVSGFITGMFVVLTPVMAWIILRHKISRHTWLAVGLAAAGLALLSLHGWAVGKGELLTFACAVFFAVHIVGLGEWSFRHDIYALTFLQLATVGIISLIASAPGGISLPPTAGVWATIIFTAVFATAVAFIVQTWAQTLVSATRAAVVMTMEPVFAGVFAVVLGGNRLDARIISGAVCVLLAMCLVQLNSGERATGVRT